MTGLDLERELGRLLHIDEARIERLGGLLAASLHRRRRRRRLWLAASLAGLAVAGWLGRPQPGRILVVYRDRADAPREGYTEPTFGQVVTDSDWVVSGTVRTVGRDRVRFEVGEVLTGRGLPRPVELLREFDQPRVSCRRALRWRSGEHLLLALFRDPADGIVKVRGSGSGQGRFPLGGVVTLGDFRAALSRGRLDAATVAQRVRAHGPDALRQLRYHLDGLLASPLPVEEPAVQGVLLEQLTAAVSGERDWQRRRSALRELRPEALAAVGEPLLGELLADLRRRCAASSSPHGTAAMLEPFARARVAAVRGLLDAVVEEATQQAAARPKADGWALLLLRLLPMLHVFDPPQAEQRAWELYRQRPGRGQADAGEVLELLLRWHAPGALEVLLEQARRAHAAGTLVWLDLLVLRPEPAARALLIEILRDPAFDLGRNRYDHQPEAAVRARGDALLRALGPVLVARLRQATGAARCRDWLGLYLAVGGELRPIAEPLAAELERVDRGGFDRMQLVRTVERALGRSFLRYRHPTDGELVAAARAMAAALRRL